MISAPVAPTSDSSPPDLGIPDLPVLRVGESLDIYAVDSVRQDWMRALSAAPGLVMELQEVRQIDTAGAQLLWSARLSALRDGKTLHFRNPSTAICNLWSRLGLPEAAFAPSQSILLP